MKKQELSRRERQAMDIIYAREKVSVNDVKALLPDAPTYSATRVLLQRLYKKGLLRYVIDGTRYIYFARTPRDTAGKDAIAKLVRTYFDGSTASAFSALLGVSSDSLSVESLDELERLIAEARSKK